MFTMNSQFHQENINYLTNIVNNVMGVCVFNDLTFCINYDIGVRSTLVRSFSLHGGTNTYNLICGSFDIGRL